MTRDREKLRQLAERATKGPWEWDAGIIPPDGPGRYADIYVLDEDREPIILAEFNDSILEGRDNARFIVAAQPAAVLSLLDEIERLEAERDAAVSSMKRVQSAAKTIMIGEADELARLRDEKRGEWLAAKTLDSEREANAMLTAEVEALKADLAEARGQRDTYREALTPSGDTKAEYIGEIKDRVMCLDEDGEEAWRDHTISWDATKATMAMILARAASVHSRLSGEGRG